MSGFCGVYGGMVGIVPCGMVWFGMVWYVSEHKHTENVGTFRNVLERLEAFWNRLNGFRAFWDLMEAFRRLGRLGSIIPCVCMVCK